MVSFLLLWVHTLVPNIAGASVSMASPLLSSPLKCAVAVQAFLALVPGGAKSLGDGIFTVVAE